MIIRPPSLEGIESGKPPTRWRFFETLLTVIAAIPSLVLFLKDYPRLGLVLLSLPALVLLWTLAPPLRNGLARVASLFRGQFLAWRERKKLRDFAARFQEFIDPSQSTTLRNIVFQICGNNWEETEKILPPDYIYDWFHCFQVDLRSGIYRFQRFARLTHALTWIVNHYNRDYVLRARDRMGKQYHSRREQHPPQQLSQEELIADEIGEPHEQDMAPLPKHYVDRLEMFREPYVRFLEEFGRWLKSLNRKLGPREQTSFMDYFEYPGRF